MATEKFQSRNIKDRGWFWTDNNAFEVVSDVFGARGVAIYAWLCRYADQDTQECFPSISKLVQKCRIKRNNVIEILRKMQDLKIIAVIKNDGRVNVYQLLKVDKVITCTDTSIPTDTGIPADTGIQKDTGTSIPTDTTPVSLRIPEQELFNNNKLTILNKEQSSIQAGFIESFSALYENQTGHQFKADKKHFVIIANLIKKYGYEATVEKAKLLAVYCQQGEVWFAREGWSCFTPETLSAHWNRIVPILSDEQKKELKNKAVREKIAEHERKVNELLKNPA